MSTSGAPCLFKKAKKIYAKAKSTALRAHLLFIGGGVWCTSQQVRARHRQNRMLRKPVLISTGQPNDVMQVGEANQAPFPRRITPLE